MIHGSCYIEESGDPGFRSPNQAMVFTAVVVERSRDRETANMMAEIKRTLNWEPEEAIRWRKLKHPKRLYAVSKMRELPVVFTNVIFHKGDMERAPGLIDRNQFYNYGIRFLLERVGCLSNPLTF